MNDQSKIEHFIERIVAGASQAQLEIESKELDLNKVGIHGRTPLMVSAAEGLLAAVETLVRNGASVHAIGRGEMTALHEASANGKAAVANYLLSLGADVNAETVDGVTPLMRGGLGKHRSCKAIVGEPWGPDKDRSHWCNRRRYCTREGRGRCRGPDQLILVAGSA